MRPHSSQQADSEQSSSSCLRHDTGYSALLGVMNSVKLELSKENSIFEMILLTIPNSYTCKRKECILYFIGPRISMRIDSPIAGQVVSCSVSKITPVNVVRAGSP